MADHVQKIKSKNNFEINFGENWSVQFWSNKFNCSPEVLRKAAYKVGAYSEAIKAYLQNKKAETIK